MSPEYQLAQTVAREIVLHSVDNPVENLWESEVSVENCAVGVTRPGAPQIWQPAKICSAAILTVMIPAAANAASRR